MKIKELRISPSAVLSVGLAAVSLACVVRLWLAELSSSLWIDEMATVFVVRHGAADPSLAVAPQVPASIYYWLPRAAEWLFGFSEVVYRIPSVLAMGVAIFLVARLATRLIHPQAAWLAAFICFGLRGINYHAADARPYALGMAVAAASVWFLVNWLDSGRRRDALLFVLFAALVWHVQLIYWPFYPVVALYAAVRLARGESRVGWRQGLVTFVLLGLVLVPVLLHALELNHEAYAHVIAPLPSVRTLAHAIRWQYVVFCGLGGWILSLLVRRPRGAAPASWSSHILFVAWWLAPPLGLFAFSWVTGNSVFVGRYFSLALPGAALAATAAVSLWLPKPLYRPVSLAFGVGVLIVLGQWDIAHPIHDKADWRGAAGAINGLKLAPDMPVICPSPFIEARWPVWRPDYPLPGFLYAHFPVYPLHARTYLFPYEDYWDAEAYAATLFQTALSPAGHFVLYGGAGNVRFWRRWFLERPELQGWSGRSLGNFGDVSVIMLEKAQLRVQ